MRETTTTSTTKPKTDSCVLLQEPNAFCLTAANCSLLCFECMKQAVVIGAGGRVEHALCNSRCRHKQQFARVNPENTVH